MRLVLSLLISVLLCASLAAAQTGAPGRPGGQPVSTSMPTTGTIRGRVVLPDGSFVSEAIKITLQMQRRDQAVTYSDQQGQFEFNGLAQGEYTLEIEADRQRNRFEVSVERVLVYRGAPASVTVFLKEKKAEGSANAPSTRVVSVGELTSKIPSKAQKEFGKASKAAQEGKTEEAITLFQKAIAIYPEYMMAYNDLGTLYLSKGKLDDAADALRRAVSIDASAFNPRLNLGIVLVQQHNFKEAVEHLEKALTLDAASPSAHYYAGQAFAGTGDAARAEKELNAAYEIGGAKYAPALFQLGQLYMEQNRSELALKAFESYLREMPDAANAEQVRRLMGMLR
jgi:tetratricopeptide (TPR) repeat protein